VVLERARRSAVAAPATMATVRVGLSCNQDPPHAGQDRLALGQVQPERRRLTGCGALTLGDHLLRHRAVLARYLHHHSPLHRTPGSRPDGRAVPSSLRVCDGLFCTKWKRSAICTALGAPPAGPFGIGPGAVPRDDLNPGMIAQPPRQGVRLAVGQESNPSAPLQVSQHGAVGVALAQRPVIHPKNRWNRAGWRRRGLREWTLALGAAVEAVNRVCQACQRIADHCPAGILTLGGTILRSHSDEVLAIVRHQHEAEKAEHPLNRIIGIRRIEDGLEVTTTDVHLPHRIGEALRRAHHGDLTVHYDKDESFARVHWQADEPGPTSAMWSWLIGRWTIRRSIPHRATTRRCRSRSRFATRPSARCNPADDVGQPHGPEIVVADMADLVSQNAGEFAPIHGPAAQREG